jgi:hypothetical protein
VTPTINDVKKGLSYVAEKATSVLRYADTRTGQAVLNAGKAIPLGAERAQTMARAPFGIISLGILFEAVKYNKQQAEYEQQRMRASYLEGERNRAREQAAMERTIDQMRASTNVQLASTLAQRGVSSGTMMMGGSPSGPAVAAMIAQAARQSGR